MPELLPTPEDARGFVSLLRRYHGACTNAGLYEIGRSLSSEPIDASPFYDAIETLRQDVASTMKRKDFIASHGWGFAFPWSLTRLKPIINGTGRSMFISIVDGRRRVDFGAVLQMLDNAAERIDDFEKAVEDVIATRGIVSASPSPASTEPSEAPAEPIEPSEAPAAPSNDLAAIASEMRKAGKEREARLVEFMSDKSEAPFHSLTKHVHEAMTSDSGIKSNITRANKSLEAMEVPLRFRVASRRVYRELPVE